MTTKKSKSCPHVFSRLMLATSAALVLFGASPLFANAETACSGTSLSGSCTISEQKTSSITLAGSDGSSKKLTVTSTGAIKTPNNTQALIVSGKGWSVDIDKDATISSSGNHAVKVDSQASGTTINNSGAITGGWYGINILSGSSDTTIQNSGNISSSRGDNSGGFIGINIAGTGVKVENKSGGSIIGSGSVASQGYAIRLESGASGTSITNESGGNIIGNVTAIQIIGTGQATSISNSGSITGNKTHGVQVTNSGSLETLTNSVSGTITAVWNAVSVEGSGKITTVTNSGTIKATNNDGKGIFVNGTGSIGTVNLEGSGLISGGTGIVVNTGTSKIDNINIKDTSSITSRSHAINNAGTITSIKIGETSSKVNTLLDAQGDGAEEPVVPKNVVITAGGAGIRNASTIGSITLTNSASITAGGNGIENNNSGKNSSISSVTISGGAQVKSSSSGIWSSGTIGTISVLGTAQATNLEPNATPQASLLSGTNGIANDGTINKIEVSGGGQISGSTSGIQNTGTIDVIHVGSNSLVVGGQYGIKNTSTGVINGIVLEGGGQISGGTQDIWNQGTIKPAQADAGAGSTPEQGNEQTYRVKRSTLLDTATTCQKAAICIVGENSKVGSILNEAVASGTGENLQYVGGLIDGDILVDTTIQTRTGDEVTGVRVSNGSNATVNGSIIGSSGSISSVSNAGTIKGDITITATSGQTVTLTNTKANGIEGKITFNGASDQSSTLKIQTWNTDIVKGEDGQPTFKHVSIDGQNGKVEVGDVVVTGVDGNVAKGSIDVKSVFSYSGYSADNPISVESVKMSDALAGAGWSGNLDKETGIFQTDFSTERSAGGIMGQTLVGQLTRRDFFLDSVLTQSAADALYNRIKDGNSGLVFAKPYVSFDSFDFDGNKVSGDTVGGIFGATGFITSHVITGFIGVEKSSLDSRYVNARMQLDSTSVYGGVSVAHVITSSDKVDTFGRVTAKVGYTRTDVDRDLNAELSHGSTDTLSYGGDLQLGANFKLSPVSRIVPMLGVGYSAGQTDDYAMENSVSLKDSYKPGSVDIPYVVGSVTWHQVWMDYLRSYFTAGVRYNLKTEQTSTAVFDGAQVTGSYELPDYYEYVSAAINMKLSRHSQFTYGYTGVFDKTGQSHNLLVQYQYLF